MTNYDKQYQDEINLFGAPYAEFEAFVREHAPQSGTALDLGCGQGRDALMLAKHGYTVTGVDGSRVGIDQMLAAAQSQNLAVTGIVADFYTYPLADTYDAIVLDSILHFGKADKSKELALLNAVAQQLNPNGYLFLFVHKSAQKERVLKTWRTSLSDTLSIVHEAYVDYVYKESVSGFQSKFQYYMLVLQQTSQ